MTKTTAQHIAEVFNNDGQLFVEPEQGYDLEDFCQGMQPTSTERRDPHDLRFTFEDGSWLAIIGDCWITDDDGQEF